MMCDFINSSSLKLEAGIVTSLVAERKIVAVYALCQGEPTGIHIHRDGKHRYSYTSHRDRQKRTVLVASSLETAPPDFDAGHAEEICGLYVYCLEDALNDSAGASWHLPEENFDVDLQSSQPQRDVDLLAFLACVVRKNTDSFQGDYRFDAKKLCAAVREAREGDRTFCWMSRPCGTWCLKEEEVFLAGSEGHTIWTYYEDTTDRILAYRVVVTGEADGKPVGDVYPLRYKEHIERINRMAVPAAAVVYTLNSGETLELPYDDDFRLAYRRMVEKHGRPRKHRYIPEIETELSRIIQMEHQAEEKGLKKQTGKKAHR